MEREKLIEYCSKFYDEHRSYLLIPFLVKEEDSQYGELPENYKNFLIGRHSRWKSEKERYAAESNSEARVDGEGEDLPKAKIDEIGKSIKRTKAESKR